MTAPESVRSAAADKGKTTYTVQVQRRDADRDADPFLAEGDAPVHLWEDIATLTTARKSPRQGVIEKALLEAGIEPAADVELRVRVLDAASAAEQIVKSFQPDPEWRVQR